MKLRNIQLMIQVSFFLSILSFFSFHLFAQSKTTIYCFPGQGSDHRLFDSLRVDTNYRLRFINYATPKKNCNMKQFAQELSQQIDSTQPFILLGVSLGGMICCELAEFMHPQKIILISSAKNRNELPRRYRFQYHIPLYRIFPGGFLNFGAKIMQPIVEPDRKHNKATFKSMLSKKTGLYMKRTVSMIINWERTSNSAEIFHIHGTKDHTLPIRFIVNPTFILENGSHMMTLTRAQDINVFLNQILK